MRTRSQASNIDLDSIPLTTGSSNSVKGSNSKLATGIMRSRSQIVDMDISDSLENLSKDSSSALSKDLKVEGTSVDNLKRSPSNNLAASASKLDHLMFDLKNSDVMKDSIETKGEVNVIKRNPSIVKLDFLMANMKELQQEKVPDLPSDGVLKKALEHQLASKNFRQRSESEGSNLISKTANLAAQTFPKRHNPSNLNEEFSEIKSKTDLDDSEITASPKQDDKSSTDVIQKMARVNKNLSITPSARPRSDSEGTVGMISKHGPLPQTPTRSKTPVDIYAQSDEDIAKKFVGFARRYSSKNINLDETSLPNTAATTSNPILSSDNFTVAHVAKLSNTESASADKIIPQRKKSLKDLLPPSIMSKLMSADNRAPIVPASKSIDAISVKTADDQNSLKTNQAPSMPKIPMFFKTRSGSISQSKPNSENIPEVPDSATPQKSIIEPVLDKSKNFTERKVSISSPISSLFSKGSKPVVKPKTSVTDHVDFLVKIADDCISLNEKFEVPGISKTDAVALLNEVTQLIIRAISLHIMLSDTAKWGVISSASSIKQTEKRSEENRISIDESTCQERNKVLLNIKEDLRELCHHIYSFTIATSTTEESTALPGWALIRRYFLPYLGKQQFSHLLNIIQMCFRT